MIRDIAEHIIRKKETSFMDFSTNHAFLSVAIHRPSRQSRQTAPPLLDDARLRTPTTSALQWRR
jgi:hypothetical protein